MAGVGRQELSVRISDMRSGAGVARRARAGAAGNYWQMCSEGGRSLSLPNAVTHWLLGLEHVPAAAAVGWHSSWLAGAAPHADAWHASW
jgi:hypothetical protein